MEQNSLSIENSKDKRKFKKNDESTTSNAFAGTDQMLKAILHEHAYSHPL